MASPTYGLDGVALAFAVVLAAALVLLISHLMPLLADVMPPVLSVDPGLLQLGLDTPLILRRHQTEIAFSRADSRWVAAASVRARDA